MHRGQPSLKAEHITPVFSYDIADVEHHQEISTVEQLGRGFVFLRRESGDMLYLNPRGAADPSVIDLQVFDKGDKVFHGVAAPTERQPSFRAVEAELFSPEEQEAMREGRCGNYKTYGNSTSSA